MTEGYYSNAMTEIALALAMAFFSVMVLAMVSMGAGAGAVDATPGPAGPGVAVAPAARADGGGAAADGAAYLFHYRGRFYDRRLEPVEPAALEGTRRVTLAVAPGLALADAIAVRSQVPGADVVVTTLDARWLEALETKESSR